MTESHRNVRVFVSSTFRDMHAERDHLVTVVFPELDERIRHIGGRLFDLDLRWGVPTADYDGERVNSWHYCRQQLDLPNQYFLAVLGHRYGYIPPVTDLTIPEDRRKWSGKSITEMEVRHAAFGGRGAGRTAFYLRDTRVPEDFEFRYAYEDDPDGQLKKLKAEIQDTGHVVRPYTCAWDKGAQRFVDLDAFGSMVVEDVWSMVLRDERFVPSSVWQRRLGEPEATRWRDGIQPLPKEIQEILAEESQPRASHPLAVERVAMDRFLIDRSEGFVGRHDELQQLVDFVRDETRVSQLCVVAGPPGTGKSALMAMLVSTLKELKDNDPIVISHFVGASTRSANVRDMLARLVFEVTGAQGLSPSEDLLWQDVTTLRVRLTERLAADAADRTVVVIDGIDNLSDPGDLSWLPTRLAPGVRIITSCVDQTASRWQPDGSIPLDAFRRLDPQPEHCHVQPLSRPQIREITMQYLRNYGRQFDIEELNAVQNVPQASNPLYLRVMLSELIRIGGVIAREQVRERVHELETNRPDVVSLFDSLLERLEYFGRDEVAQWFCYLASGRTGFSGHELSELLTAKLGAAAGLTARRIERSVRPYLSHYGERWDFFHNSFKDAVLRRYLSEDEIEIHTEIAAFFEQRWKSSDKHALEELPFHLSRADRQKHLKDLLLTYDWLRRKSELLGCGEIISDFEHLADEDDDLNMLRRTLGIASHIIETYPSELPSQLAGRLPRDYESRLWQLCRQALEEHADNWLCPASPVLAEHDPAAWRTLTLGGFQRRIMVHNDDGSTTMPEFNVITAVALTNDGKVAANAWYGLIIIWDVRRGVPMRTLEAHTDDIISVAFVPNTDLLLSASHDGDVHLWDYRRGQKLRTHHDEGMVTALDVSSDGRLAGWLQGNEATVVEVTSWETLANCHTSAGYGKSALSIDGNRYFHAVHDNELIVGSLYPAAELRRFPVHSNSYVMRHTEISMATLAGNGRLALTASEPGVNTGLDDMDAFRHATSMKLLGKLTGERSLEMRLRCGDSPEDVQALADFQRMICVWDLENGVEVDRIPVLGKEIKCAATSKGNGRHWMAGGDIRLVFGMDAQEGRRKLFAGHDRDVTAVAVTPDGSFGASGSDDTSVRIWDLKQPQGSMLALETHVLAVSADSEYVFAGTLEGIAVYDSLTGDRVATLNHRDAVATAIVPASDGSHLVAGFSDGTVQLWDTVSNRCVWSCREHTNSVTFAAVTSNGCFAITAHLTDSSIPGMSREVMNDPDFLRDSLGIPESPGDAYAKNARYVVKVWNLKTGEATFDFSDSTDAMIAAVLMSDDRSFVAAIGGELLVWDIWTGILKHRIQVHESIVRSLIPSSLDNEVLVWAADSSLSRVNIKSGNVTRTFHAAGEFDANRATRVSGHMCLAGRYALNLFTVVGRDFEVYNLIDGTVTSIDSEHDADINRIVSSPDGTRIVTISDDHQLKTWDTKTGQTLASYTADVALTHCCFLPDGSAIAAGDNQGRVHIVRPAGVWAGLHSAEVELQRDNCESARGHLDGVIERLADVRNVIRGQRSREECIRLLLEISEAYLKADRLEDSPGLITCAEQIFASMDERLQSNRERALNSICSAEVDYATALAGADDTDSANQILSGVLEKAKQQSSDCNQDWIFKKWCDGKRAVVASLARNNNPEAAREEYLTCTRLSPESTQSDESSGGYIDQNWLRLRMDIFASFVSAGHVAAGWNEYIETLPLLFGMDEYDRDNISSAWADGIASALIDTWQSSREDDFKALSQLCEQASMTADGDHRDDLILKLCEAHLDCWKAAPDRDGLPAETIASTIDRLRRVDDNLERDYLLDRIAEKVFFSGRFDELESVLSEMRDEDRDRWLRLSPCLAASDAARVRNAIELAKKAGIASVDSEVRFELSNWIVASLTWFVELEDEPLESIRMLIDEAERETATIPSESLKDTTRLSLAKGIAQLAVREATDARLEAGIARAQRCSHWAQQTVNDEYRQECLFHVLFAWLGLAEVLVSKGETSRGFECLNELDEDWRQAGIAIMSRAAAEAGFDGEAAELATKAEASIPADPHAAECAHMELAEMGILAGRSRLESGKLDEAQTHFQHAQSIIEHAAIGAPDFVIRLAESYWLLGINGEQRNETKFSEAAINWLTGAADTSGGRRHIGQIKSWLVRLKQASGDNSGAIEIADSLKDEPWRTVVASTLAAGYAEAGEVELARTLMDSFGNGRDEVYNCELKALLEEHLCYAWATIGEALIRRNTPDEGTAMADSATDLAVRASIWTGMAYASMNEKPDNARGWIARAQSLLNELATDQSEVLERWIADVLQTLNNSGS